MWIINENLEENFMFEGSTTSGASVVFTSIIAIIMIGFLYFLPIIIAVSTKNIKLKITVLFNLVGLYPVAFYFATAPKYQRKSKTVLPRNLINVLGIISSLGIIVSHFIPILYYVDEITAEKTFLNAFQCLKLNGSTEEDIRIVTIISIITIVLSALLIFGLIFRILKSKPDSRIFFISTVSSITALFFELCVVTELNLFDYWNLVITKFYLIFWIICMLIILFSTFIALLQGDGKYIETSSQEKVIEYTNVLPENLNNNSNNEKKNKKKKVIVIVSSVLAIILVFSFCGHKESKDNNKDKNSTSIQTEIKNDDFSLSYIDQTNINSGGFMAKDEKNLYIARTYGICYSKLEDMDKPFEDYFTLTEVDNLNYRPNLIADNNGNVYYMTSDEETHINEYICYNIENETYKKLFSGYIVNVIYYDDTFYYIDYIETNSKRFKLMSYSDGETKELRTMDGYCGVCNDLYAENGYIYFAQSGDENTLYRYDIDKGGDLENLLNAWISSFTVYNGKIYYSIVDEGDLMQFNPSNKENITIYSSDYDGVIKNMKLVDSDLFYTFNSNYPESNTSGNYKCNINSGVTELFLKNMRNFNCIDNQLYYLIDNDEENINDRVWIIKKYNGDVNQSITKDEAIMLSHIDDISSYFATSEDESSYIFEARDHDDLTISVNKYSGEVNAY